MNAVRICFLLIFVLIAQSAAAFYDSHSELQDAGEHVPVHHSDAGDHIDPLDAPASHDHGKKLKQDCHHCCHCHSPSHFYALGPATPLTLSEQQLRPSAYIPDFLSLSSPPDLQPPIA